MRHLLRSLALVLALALTGCATYPAAEARQAYVRGHPNLPMATQSAILDARPAVGMTEEDLRVALGEPVRVNVTTTAAGREEQRVYRRYNYYQPIWQAPDPERIYYVYVRGGRVVTIQETR